MSLILSGTDGVSDVDGTAATPALRGSDTNTGIFFPAADTIAFAEGGVESARLDSAGNFGLGVTPSAWGSLFRAFQFGPNGGSINARTDSNQAIEFALNWYFDGATTRYINSNWATRYRQFAGAHEWYTAPSGTAGNTVSFTQAMTLDSSGWWQNRQGTATTYIGDAGAIVTSGTSGASALRAENALVFATGGSTERARIDTSGNLLVGTTSGSGQRISVVNSGSECGVSVSNGTNTSFFAHAHAAGNYISGSSANDAIVRGANGVSVAGGNGTNGVRVASGGTSWSALSDERHKDIIEPIANAASKVSMLRAVIGKYKTDEDGVRRSFLIAQDVQQVLPEAVVSENPDALALSYTDLIPLLTAAIKEQQAIIEQLTTRIAALEAK